MISEVKTDTELRGLSTDTKPDDYPNGTKFVEMDTFVVYYFDESTGDWITKENEGE